VTKFVVARGVVHVPDPHALAAQRRLDLLSNGHAARNGQHLRRFQPGDTITVDDVGAAELARLVALGVCRPVPP
jgi:hypothetical protein